MKALPTFTDSLLVGNGVDPTKPVAYQVVYDVPSDWLTVYAGVWLNGGQGGQAGYLMCRLYPGNLLRPGWNTVGNVAVGSSPPTYVTLPENPTVRFPAADNFPIPWGRSLTFVLEFIDINPFAGGSNMLLEFSVCPWNEQ